MSLAARFAAQLAHPRGFTGRVLGRAMDFANERPLRLAIETLAPRSGEWILDVGCGTGAALAAIRSKADCTVCGVDRSAAMIADARRRLGGEVELALQDIESIPGRWPPFDAMLALNVLYFADPAGAMVAAMHRLLRPGGRLVVYVTHRRSMKRWPFTRAGVHRLYDVCELEQALAQAGFARAQISISQHSVAPTIWGLIAHAVR